MNYRFIRTNDENLFFNLKHVNGICIDFENNDPAQLTRTTFYFSPELAENIPENPHFFDYFKGMSVLLSLETTKILLEWLGQNSDFDGKLTNDYFCFINMSKIVSFQEKDSNYDMFLDDGRQINCRVYLNQSNWIPDPCFKAFDEFRKQRPDLFPSTTDNTETAP